MPTTTASTPAVKAAAKAAVKAAVPTQEALAAMVSAALRPLTGANNRLTHMDLSCFQTVCQLAVAYWLGFYHYDTGDHAQALGHFVTAARDGVRGASYYICRIYSEGRGVPQDAGAGLAVAGAVGTHHPHSLAGPSCLPPAVPSFAR